MKKSAVDVKINKVKFFQKHVVEGKTVTACSEEMGTSKVQLYHYKKSDDYRRMALAYLDDSSLGGVDGVMAKLIAALDAVRPHNKETVNADGSTNIEVEFVADTNARLKALQEVHKIYGFYAPQKRDVEVTVSLSSDADLFKEIDEAERNSKFVGSYKEREGRFELAPDPQRASLGSVESRKRLLLQGTSISES